MTYANFKTTVLSYTNRASATFTSGALDYVLIAMNDARRSAQRQYTFNLARRTAFAQVSLAPTSLLTDFDADPTGAGATVVVKQLDGAYEYASASVSGTTRYYRTNQMILTRHSAFAMEADISPVYFGSTSTQQPGQLAAAKQFIYLQGSNVYHSTLTTPTWYLFDVIEWIADHDGGSGEDIFLTYFVDWLKYATIMNMNQYLKDGERFPIDAQFVASLWESVKQFDAQQGAATGSIMLD